MYQELNFRKISINVSGVVVRGFVLKDHGVASRIHMKDVILESSGAGVVTIRDKVDDRIIQKTFTADDKFLNITSADLFGGGGRLMMDISTSVTITGTIMYWKEDLGRSPVK